MINFKNIVLIRMIKKGISIDVISNKLCISIDDINNFKKIMDVVSDLNNEGYSNLEICNCLGLSIDEFSAIVGDSSNKIKDNSNCTSYKKVNKFNNNQYFGSVYPTKEIQDEIMGYLCRCPVSHSSNSIDYSNDYDNLSFRNMAKEVCSDFGTYVLRTLKKK